jgi:hypothetical protein
MSAVLIGLTVSCSSNEPSERIIQQSFQHHFDDYNELLNMFRADVIESNVSFVSAESLSRTQCEFPTLPRDCTLREGRWAEYQQHFQKAGILWIEHDKQANGYYFVTYYEPILMNARLRGVVFSERKDPQVSAYYPKQHWWSIQNNWYSFLMIDC